MCHFDRPVGFCPSFARGRLPETRQRFSKHENAGRTIALVFVIDTLTMLLRRGDWYPSLLEQLDRLFVHTQNGMLRVVGFCIGFEHFFHASHKLGILRRRNYPILNLPLRHAIFFSTLRTVS